MIHGIARSRPVGKPTPTPQIWAALVEAEVVPIASYNEVLGLGGLGAGGKGVPGRICLKQTRDGVQKEKHLAHARQNKARQNASWHDSTTPLYKPIIKQKTRGTAISRLEDDSQLVVRAAIGLAYQLLRKNPFGERLATQRFVSTLPCLEARLAEYGGAPAASQPAGGGAEARADGDEEVRVRARLAACPLPCLGARVHAPPGTHACVSHSATCKLVQSSAALAALVSVRSQFDATTKQRPTNGCPADGRWRRRRGGGGRGRSRRRRRPRRRGRRRG